MNVLNITVFLQRKAKNQQLIANYKQPIAKNPIIAKILPYSDNIIIIITGNYKNKQLSTLRTLDYFFASNQAKFF